MTALLKSILAILACFVLIGVSHAAELDAPVGPVQAATTLTGGDNASA